MAFITTLRTTRQNTFSKGCSFFYPNNSPCSAKRKIAKIFFFQNASALSTLEPLPLLCKPSHKKIFDFCTCSTLSALGMLRWLVKPVQKIFYEFDTSRYAIL